MSIQKILNKSSKDEIIKEGADSYISRMTKTVYRDNNFLYKLNLNLIVIFCKHIPAIIRDDLTNMSNNHVYKYLQPNQILITIEDMYKDGAINETAFLLSKGYIKHYLGNYKQAYKLLKKALLANLIENSQNSIINANDMQNREKTSKFVLNSLIADCCVITRKQINNKILRHASV